MNTALVQADHAAPMAATGELHQYVCVYAGGQSFGIPVLQVQDVLLPQRIGQVPLAPPEIAGLLNLRGRIVTAINLHRRLGITQAIPEGERMSVVIDRDGELYSLLVDEVGEVLNLPEDTFETNPANLNPKWRDISLGVHRLENDLLTILDVARLLEFNTGVEKL